MAEVVDFKKKKEEKEQKRFDEILDKFIENENYINELTVTAGIEIIEFLAENDIDVESNPDSIKDLFLMLEAIKGTIHRVMGTPYEIHEITDEMFEGIEDTSTVMHRFLYGEDE